MAANKRPDRRLHHAIQRGTGATYPLAVSAESWLAAAYGAASIASLWRDRKFVPRPSSPRRSPCHFLWPVVFE